VKYIEELNAYYNNLYNNHEHINLGVEDKDSNSKSADLEEDNNIKAPLVTFVPKRGRPLGSKNKPPPVI
jgi:hypothetical protein